MISLFPVAVGLYKNVEILESTRQLFTECAPYFKITNDGIESTIGKYSPGTCVHEVDLRNFEGGILLERFIINSVTEYLRELQYIQYKVIVKNMWLNSMPTGTLSPIHSHYGYAFSGCYYVECTQNNNVIQFHNPLSDNFYQPPMVQQYNPYNSSVWTVPIEEGSLVVFPSFLRHGVPPNVELQPRRSIAFDVALLNDW